MPAALKTWIDFGPQLKAERERQSLQLEHVAVSIKVREQYLDAIERHDWTALPEPVFTRGYIQSYAEFLHMDSGLIMKAYAREMRIASAEHPVTEKAEAEAAKALLERLAEAHGGKSSKSSDSRRGKRWVAPVLVVVVVGVCAGAAALLLAPGLSLARGLRHVSSEAPIAAASVETVGSPESIATSRDPTGLSNPRDATDPSSPGDTSQPPAEPAETSGSPAPQSAPTSPQPNDTSHPSAMPTETSSTDSKHETPAARLSITDFGVGTAVRNHRLVGRSENFNEGTNVWFWTRIIDGRMGDEMRHVWFHEGRVMGVARLRIGGSGWRIYSRWQLEKGSSGNWSVEARDEEDRVLATATFRCD